MKVVVLGGGIAGTSCASQLLQLPQLHQKLPQLEVLIVSASRLVKISTAVQVSRFLEEIEVHEAQCVPTGAQMIVGVVQQIDPLAKTLRVDGEDIKYDKLCIATGARPMGLRDKYSEDSVDDFVVKIRDVESVQDIRRRLGDQVRKILVVGNGGIAMEFVYSVYNGINIVWAIRSDHVGSIYLDEAAATFLVPFLNNQQTARGSVERKEVKQEEMEYQMESEDIFGAGAGPKWASSLGSFGEKGKIQICTNVDVINIQKLPDNSEWPIVVTLSNGEEHECDLVLSAIGVKPNTAFCDGILEMDDEGAIVVNEFFQCSRYSDIYAIGDCCSVRMPENQTWFQMRLWSQARLMGIVEDEFGVWIQFELFAHCTRFFGVKVVLLGLYNAQGLEDQEYKVLIRDKAGDTHVKVIIYKDRVVGAVLLGDTDLEETFENLILNQLNIAMFGNDLLRDDIDLEDYFD